MKILHTSDLHLSQKSEATLHALNCILESAEKLSIDLLSIGGDLFDSERDAESLRPKLRDIFQGNRFPIVAIPGNHDVQAYVENLDFGSDLRVPIERPFSKLPFGEVCLVTLPYTDVPDTSLITALQVAAKEYKVRILLMHCTLDMGFSMGDFGDEAKKTYFSVTRETLSRLGYKYVFAGHFHTQPYHIILEGGCHFIYPGSPVSLSKKETGKRHYYVIDTETESIESVSFNTFFYDNFIIHVTPGKEEQVLRLIQEWITERLSYNCSLEVTVRGFIQTPETEFRKDLTQMESDKIVIHREYKNVQYVLAHPLYQRFKKVLESEQTIENKDSTDDLVIDTLSQLLAGRQLRA